VFAQSVYESGVSEGGVTLMIKDNPLNLLELPSPPPLPEATTNGAARDGEVQGDELRQTV
jgi:hypothetical protein